MSIRWNWNALEQAQREAARRILYASTYFVDQHRARLGKPNPRPYQNSSKPGEYPARRTGIGTANIGLEIVENGLKARIGLRPQGKHLAILELWKGRLGFVQTSKEIEDRIKAILES